MFKRVLTVGAVSLVLLACGTAASSPTAGGGTGAQGGSASSGPTVATGGGGGTVGDPCALLTQAEVSAALGVSVGAGSAAEGESHGCTWVYAPSNGVPTAQANIDILVGTSFASLCNVPSSSALGITIVQVSGVGDGACFTTMAGLGAGTNLTFEKGGQVYSVSAVLPSGATDAAIEAADRMLALDAIAKL